MRPARLVFYISTVVSTLFFILWIGGIFVINMFRNHFSHLTSDNVLGVLFAPFAVFLVSGIVAAVTYATDDSRY